ncbi:uncharacterized protein FTJAE_12955 [Fusarium tjaetaba]|uniref:Uncharacterized protein n=1 Tax=Fusarium tjaetaba TaxID=1567544 RepID=A0A8H5QL23_9HYPO|nr:uncharacterized protein FTJAE_12955 [Fusarium tjaetaba]KAF5616462.1 hypothetical protein FTJAE_12955 [Fusarium tjaetaba]
MSFANGPLPNPSGQPNRPSLTLNVDNYWVEADEILQRLSETLKERPAIEDPNRRVDTGIWWVKIISLRLKFNWVIDRFQQDPSIGPTLRAMLRSFLKLNPLEDILPDEEMSSESFPAADELRNRLKRLVDTEPKNDEEAEQKRKDIIADAALYIWFLSQTKEECEMEKSEGDVGGPSPDGVLRAQGKKKDN